MLRSGDIVTVRSEHSPFYGKQGLIIKIQLCFWGNPEFIVRFDREQYPYHLREDEFPNGFLVVCDPNYLSRDTDWKPEVYARRTFGIQWHSVSVLKSSRNLDSLCMVHGCCNTQHKTIWFNIWGSVCNAHVCKKHGKMYHRFRGDSFPWRQKESA